MTVGVEIDFVVPDSREALELYEKVFEAERIEVTDLKRGQNEAVTEIPQMGVANSVFTDPFGYMWMLHQMHREVSFEERVRVMEEMCGE